MKYKYDNVHFTSALYTRRRVVFTGNNIWCRFKKKLRFSGTTRFTSRSLPPELKNISTETKTRYCIICDKLPLCNKETVATVLRAHRCCESNHYCVIVMCYVCVCFLCTCPTGSRGSRIDYENNKRCTLPCFGGGSI